MYGLVKLNKVQGVSRLKDKTNEIVRIGEETGVMYMREGDRERLKSLGGFQYIEDPFTIELKGNFKPVKNALPKDVLAVYIGRVETDVDSYNLYNLDTQMFAEVKEVQNIYIAYSHQTVINSIQYLTFIIDFMQKAIEKNKKLIIYADIETRDHTLKYRSLLGKIINELLDEIGAVIIYRLYGEMKNYYVPTPNSFEPYIEYAIYTYDDFETAILKVSYLLQQGYKHFYIRRAYRQEKMSLYDNLFYRQIPEEERIYVPVLGTQELTYEEYKEVGLEYIKLLGTGGILSGTKKTFDEQTVLLRKYIVPEYIPEILTHPDIRTYPIPNGGEIEARQEQIYNGEGVYIGVIGVKGINYTSSDFLKPNGKSRLIYAWSQIEGDKGVDYTAEDISQSIQEQSMLPIYTDDKKSMEKIILEIAGGKVKMLKGDYKSVASQAEFMYAKINPASRTIQEIYGGIPDCEAVLLEDVIIAIDRLVNKALAYNRPLVLCIPFGSNMGSHDGTSDLERKIAEYARIPGITIMTSTGEEADKMHHASINNNFEDKIALRISQSNQKVIGQIWSACWENKELKLYTPSKITSYNLGKEGVYTEDNYKILVAKSTRGYAEGRKNIMFSLENPKVGDWEILIQCQESSQYDDRVDIWLAGQELNSNSTLFKSDVFMTLPSIANNIQLLCVGDFDNNTNTTYKSSGRGYTSQSIVKPSLVAQGTEVWRCDEHGENEFAGGSLVAMANVAGVVAAIYSKAIAEKVNPTPNTIIMTSILLSRLYRIETVDYPNQSQGNGIFNRDSLNSVLSVNKTLYE